MSINRLFRNMEGSTGGRNSKKRMDAFGKKVLGWEGITQGTQSCCF